MGHYTSIRGWLAISDSMLPQINEIIHSSAERCSELGMDRETCEFYNQGWVFPEHSINWTYYIFYGADIRSYHIRYLKRQLALIAESVVEHNGEFTNDVEGVFHVNDEDEESEFEWEIRGGKLTAFERKQLLRE
jgi:hypothetical protein